MGDMAAVGKALDERRKEARHRRHRMNYGMMMSWEMPDDIALQRKNRDTHWIILAFGNRWDFWPSTGLMHFNGKQICRVTFRNLIQRVDRLRS